MERTVQFLLGVTICIALSACSRAHPSNVEVAQIRAKLDAIPLDQKVDLTNKEWLVILSPQQFYIMRRSGTELPSFSGNALDHHNGTYVCSACGNPLYSAETKFNSGTGWPSFFKPFAPPHIKRVRDASYGMVRVEEVCARCGSHLGHVFPDGPPPTGERHCLNSVSLGFTPTGEALPDFLKRGTPEGVPGAGD